MNSDLFSNYHLIAFDLPCHGKSGPLQTDEVSLPAIAKLMSEAVKKVVAEKPYVLAGVSLGTNTIAEMLAFDINPAGIILAGPCIIGENISLDRMMKPNTFVHVVFNDDVAENDILSYTAEASVSKDSEDRVFFLRDYDQVQKPFRSLLGKSISENLFSDEICLLRKANAPILMLFGSDEKIINTDYLDNISLPAWKNQIFKIAGASHLVNIDEPGQFNSLAAEFIDDIFK